MDNRRRRYVPLDVYTAFGKTGTHLLKKWGMEGLCTWHLLLAAAKREPIQGTFTYVTDVEAWAKLGAAATLFTVDEFFAFTGRIKQTRKTRVGRIKNVEITQWGDWNKAFERQTEAEKKSRTRPQNTGDNPPTTPGQHRDDTATEGEVELEDEVTKGRLVVSYADLPSEKQRLTDKILRWCGDDADIGTTTVLAGLAARLPEGSIAKVAESCLSKDHVLNRARYAAGSLKLEIEERAA
jgi:hypothetical protein